MDEPDDAELAAEFGPLLRQELTDLEEVSEQTGADRAPVTLDQQSVGQLAHGCDADAGHGRGDGTPPRAAPGAH